MSIQGQLGPGNPCLDDEPVGVGHTDVQVEGFGHLGSVSGGERFEGDVVQSNDGLGNQVSCKVIESMSASPFQKEPLRVGHSPVPVIDPVILAARQGNMISLNPGKTWKGSCLARYSLDWVCAASRDPLPTFPQVNYEARGKRLKRLTDGRRSPWLRNSWGALTTRSRDPNRGRSRKRRRYDHHQASA